MEEPITQAANDIIEAVVNLRAALMHASASDRCMAVILACDDLVATYSRCAADYGHFAAAFSMARPPVPRDPRGLTGAQAHDLARHLVVAHRLARMRRAIRTVRASSTGGPVRTQSCACPATAWGRQPH
jgi:hypothetical protein